MLRRLPDFLLWANSRTLESVRRVQVDKARRLMAHVLAAEEIWLEKLLERIPAIPVWPDFLPADADAWVLRNADGYRALISDDLLSSCVVAYKNAKVNALTSSAADVLTHVMTHGAYHRGEARSLRLWPLPAEHPP